MPPANTYELDVFILSAESFTQGDRSKLLFYGSSKEGPVRATLNFEPYYFRRSSASSHPSSLHSLKNEPVTKLDFPNIPAAENARIEFKNRGVTLYESDVRSRDRFLMDRLVNGAVTLRGTANRRDRLLCFDEPSLEPAHFQPKFRICSLDIETSISSQTLLSIGVHVSGAGEEIRHVFMRGDESNQDGVTFLPDERRLLEAFLAWFSVADPDIIIGWNVIGFDLTFLETRAKHVGMNLNLGRGGREFSIRERSGSFSRATVPGRVVLDGPQLLRSSFHTFDSFSLEFVSQSVLGEGKLIAPVPDKASDNRGWEIERLFKQDKAALAAYNLNDAVLVTKIFEKLQLLELTVRRTQLSGMLLDQVGMSVASLDHFMLPRLHRLGFVAPDLEDVGRDPSTGGGYVISPKAGIYEQVIGLDFQSLYPSIIRTFFIDPLSLACADIDPVRTPSGHAFSRSKHILPEFITHLMAARGQAKSERNKPLSQAIKILMNSFYGVMGTFGSRLYHPALPDAITGTGQWLLVESKSWLQANGHRVIYGDTDSLFVQHADRSISFDGGLAADLTSHWKARLPNEFEVESQLVVEFKKQYRKFLVPAIRGGEEGAKKRYAGLVVTGEVEELEFVGLEVVRSDWTKLAQDFQVELYTRVFHEEPLQEWLRGFVDRLRQGAFDEKLVYRKRLHKPLEEYGKSAPVYVRAARQLAKPSRSVRYVMTTLGPVPVELEPRNPDYAHYVDKQLKPVADSVLGLLGTSFDELTKPQQLKLF